MPSRGREERRMSEKKNAFAALSHPKKRPYLRRNSSAGIHLTRGRPLSRLPYRPKDSSAQRVVRVSHILGNHVRLRYPYYLSFFEAVAAAVAAAAADDFGIPNACFVPHVALLY